jgi:hypothetical protein
VPPDGWGLSVLERFRCFELILSVVRGGFLLNRSDAVRLQAHEMS